MEPLSYWRRSLALKTTFTFSGQGPGTSHLHAFDRDGTLLWQSVRRQRSMIWTLWQLSVHLL